MGRMSMETRTRVVLLAELGMGIVKIHMRLREEGIEISRTSLYQLLKKFQERSTVKDIRWWKPQTKLGEAQYPFVDEQMAANTELTSSQLHKLIQEQFPHITVSVSTVKRARRHMGWVCKRTRYCALIQEVDKEKRLKFCRSRMDNSNTFDVAVWTDECTVPLESHRLHSYHKEGQPAPLKGQLKHPPKLLRSTFGVVYHQEELIPL